MISVTHFDSAEPDFAERARLALATLSQRPGYLRGSFARSTDSDSRWVIVTEWESVGAYRRALGAYEVKMYAAQLLGEALDQDSAFEPVLSIADGQATEHPTYRA